MSTATADRVVSDGRLYVAAKLSCRKHAPDLFFASHFLGKGERGAVYSVAAVCQQLREIADPCAREVKPCGGSGGEGGAAGCEACGVETPEERRRVCVAVLGHLFSGQKTGKAELDGFHAVVTERNPRMLSRKWFEEYAGGVVDLRTAKRVGTWGELSEKLGRSAGSLGLIGAELAGAEVESVRNQAAALGTGMGLARLINRVGEDWKKGRFYLPGEDLERFGLTEADLARFGATVISGSDERWRRLLDWEIDRARKLIVGGVKTLSPRKIEDRRVARASAVLAAIHLGLLDRLGRPGVDLFGGPVRMSHWMRLRMAAGAGRKVRLEA